MDKNAIMKNFREQKELMEDKIKHGIEANRKGYFKINFIDENGKPLNGADVKIRQKTSEFKFGCNLFKLGCFEKDEDNANYAEYFKKLFNLATIPFYWDDFEPTDGHMRFDKDSEFIDRRIPPEYALEFCRENNIEAKGHPLFWHAMMPQWLPQDFEQMKDYWTRRLKAIAERYDGVIKTFDCVNECCSVPIFDDELSPTSPHYRNQAPISGTFPEYAFKQTAHYFRKSRLVLNEAAGPWSDYKKELSYYYLLAENLINKGCKVDIIGLQYHNFNTPENMADLAKHYYNPVQLYKVMDTYAKLGRPMSVSEITVPGYDEDLQAEILCNLYRIWFSHPAMESIIYWNLGDNCAVTSANHSGWAGEDGYVSGFFRSDFTKKPVYDEIDRLINHEWRTNTDLAVNDDHVYFKAFYGDYEITAVHDGKEVTRSLHLSKNGYDEFYYKF